MPNTLQEFLATAIPKAAVDLETALRRLPEDKWNWSAMGDARSALDMVAEAALLNDMTQIVTTRSFPKEYDMESYTRAKSELAQDWERMRPMLHENAARSAATVRTVPDEDLGIEIQMPWGPYTISQIISYPYWNMSYHEGQINFIASMLGCLD
jgi:hypothetical protein